MARTKFLFSLSLSALIALSVTSATMSRTLSDVNPKPLQKAAADPPFINGATHSVGKIALTVTNTGTFGTGYVTINAGDPSCEYPINSTVEYLYGGAFWIGAIVGRDTLVSVGHDGWQPCQEFHPPSEQQQDDNDEEVLIRSISNPNDPNLEFAKSEHDVVTFYYDTLTDGVCSDFIDGRPHTPLNIRVKETSYSWSYSYAEDFVLFDYAISNIGFRALEKVYMGIYVDADVGSRSNGMRHVDDVCGFRVAVEGLKFGNVPCTFQDTINIAWITDNQGLDDDATRTSGDGKYHETDPISVAGDRVVRTPNKDSLGTSFNWWVGNGNAPLDFGPRRKEAPGDPFRDFGGYLGTPEGDRTKYYVMRHKEFDYDQLFTAVDHSAEGWLPPPSRADQIATGFDTRYLISWGPFTVFPGETLPITFAHVMGADFHGKVGGPIKANSDNSNPQPFYDNLNFKDFGTNAQWASWLYDNPGIDSDGDGYKGKYRVCYEGWDVINEDTFFNELDPQVIDSIVFDTHFIDSLLVYYEGDGIPDFRGASPPPSAFLRVTPKPGQLRIRWNGLASETTPDDFSAKRDFEGYRVYHSFTNLGSQLTLAASYDRQNYRKYNFDDPSDKFTIDADPPMSKRMIQVLYANGSMEYDPLTNTIDRPLRIGDSTFYFAPQDFNRFDLSDTMWIYKVYPQAPYPHTLFRDSAFAWGVDTFFVDSLGDTTVYPNGELTPEGGWFQHFEYEYIMRNLTASQLNYVSVTSFDFGAPASGLESMESNPFRNMVSEYAQNGTDAILSKDLQVISYPNPYRIDGNYRDDGFEGRTETDEEKDRVREVHFTNLPATCTISIFTLDGDMVRQIVHDVAANSYRSMHDSWDLITRNSQLASSGLYYWVIETPDGNTQIGKLVLIM